jgi:hypothetical protein
MRTLNSKTSSINGYLAVTIIASIVLILWLILGFLIPYYFGSLEISGQFGDGFGAVNSLFTGFGFVGLIYTIILQMRSLSIQREQELFSLHMKLIDDAKEDFQKVQWKNFQGASCIQELVEIIGNDFKNIKDGELNMLLSYLLSCILQFDHLRRTMLKYEQDENFENFNVMASRLIPIYLPFVVPLGATFKAIEFDYKHQLLNHLRRVSARLYDDMQKTIELHNL